MEAVGTPLLAVKYLAGCLRHRRCWCHDAIASQTSCRIADKSVWASCVTCDLLASGRGGCCRCLLALADLTAKHVRVLAFLALEGARYNTARGLGLAYPFDANKPIVTPAIQHEKQGELQHILLILDIFAAFLIDLSKCALVGWALDQAVALIKRKLHVMRQDAYNGTCKQHTFDATLQEEPLEGQDWSVSSHVSGHFSLHSQVRHPVESWM